MDAKGFNQTMPKQCVALIVLALAFVGLFEQCEAHLTFGLGPLSKLHNWVIKQNSPPKAGGIDSITIKNCIGFIKQAANSLNLTKPENKALKENKVKKLFDAIARLSLDNICSEENLVEADKVKKLALGSREFTPKILEDEYSVKRAVYVYLYRANICRSIAKAVWDPVRLENKFQFRTLNMIDRVNDYIREGTYSSDDDEARRLQRALQRQNSLAEYKAPFEGRETFYAITANLQPKPQHYTKDMALYAIERYLKSPCEDLVLDEVNEDYLHRIVLLAPFLDLKDASCSITDEATIRWASRYLTCKVLLLADLDKLAKDVWRASNEQED